MFPKRHRHLAWLSPLFFIVAAASAQTQATYKVLHNFQYGEQGQIGPPGDGVALDTHGNVYGGAGGGTICGGFGCGLIYELRPLAGGKWSFSIIYEFTGGSGGAYPQQVLIDASGNLFGTLAGDGGAAVPGVYELANDSGNWNFNMLYPAGCCLVFDANGNLYGELGQGHYKGGAIGELSPGSSGWTYTQLYSFCDAYGCPDGQVPDSPFSWDTQGNLYGTTIFGGYGSPKCPGSAGCGVAFQLTPNGDGTWTFHGIHRFASYKGDGEYPYAGLVVDASGNVYGATAAGGAHGNGTIFKFVPDGDDRWTQIVLYDFPNCADGCGPASTMVFDQAGNLYGSAGGGNQSCGPDTCGVIYKLTPQANGTWKYSLVYKFHGTDGAFPYGVTLDTKGDIFGTTEGGGTYNTGVAFEIIP